jgi:hypothetical protein
MITPRTSPLITIPHTPRRPIIPRANNPSVSDQHAAYPTLHAITPLGSKVGEVHKVGIPGGPQTGGIMQVGNVEDRVQFG